MSSNIPAPQSTLNLTNSNFLSGLGQISNAPKSVPMNKMMSNTPFLSSAQPSSFQNSADSLSALSPMIPNQSNSSKKNGQENTVALSAQEINDFLS